MTGDGIRRTLVILSKSPVAGQVKTRLSPAVTPDQAARLHCAFLVDLANTLRRLGNSVSGLQCVLAFSGDRDHPGFAPFDGKTFERWSQGRGDLGQRLARITSRAFDEGAEQVVVIGSDSPTLETAQLADAFDALGRVDVALGPSFDGGYYLIALRERAAEVFEKIDWSSNRVLSQTVQRCHGRSLLCELLGFWYDVDTPEDLERLRFHLLEAPSSRSGRNFTATASELNRIFELD
jgi:uncharacterized protein